MNKLYPLLVTLTGKRVLVFGGGKVANRKAFAVLQKGAIVTAISPHFTKEWFLCQKQFPLSLKLRTGKLSDIKKKYFLVFTATNDKVFNHRLTNLACKKGILCNDVSEKHQTDTLSTFRNVCYFNDSSFIVSVFSGGKPLVSKKFLAAIQKKILPQYRNKNRNAQ